MNHRIFERKLRSLDTQGACLSECRFQIYTPRCGVRVLGLSEKPNPSLEVPEPDHVSGRLKFICPFLTRFAGSSSRRLTSTLTLYFDLRSGKTTR